MMYLQVFLGWLVLALVAILNGTVRVALLVPQFGEHAAHVIASATGACLVFLVTYAFVRTVGRAYGRRDLLTVGALWLALTVAFEFLFGHFVIGHPWSVLFADYNVAKGRVWLLVLLAVFWAPYVCGARRAHNGEG